MVHELKSLAFGYAAAIVVAIGMLILGVLGNLGLYVSAVQMMEQWHMYFFLTPVGIIAGIIEVVIISIVFACLLGVFYNNLS